MGNEKKASVEEINEERSLDVYDELNHIKTQVAVVIVEQTQIRAEQTSLRADNGKIATTLENIARQINLDEQAAAAIRERTDQHSKNIEHLQALEVDNSKILSQHDKVMSQHDSDIKLIQAQWNNFIGIIWAILKWGSVTIGGLGIGVLFSHFIK